MTNSEWLSRGSGGTEQGEVVAITAKWFTPASGRTVPVRKAADEAPHWVTIDGNPVLIGAGSRRKPYSKAYPLWEYAPSLGKDIPYGIAPRPPDYKGSRHWYSPDFLPDAVKQDLKTAMAKEGVPASEYDDLA